MQITHRKLCFTVDHEGYHAVVKFCADRQITHSDFLRELVSCALDNRAPVFPPPIEFDKRNEEKTQPMPDPIPEPEDDPVRPTRPPTKPYRPAKDTEPSPDDNSPRGSGHHSF